MSLAAWRTSLYLPLWLYLYAQADRPLVMGAREVKEFHEDSPLSERSECAVA